MKRFETLGYLLFSSKILGIKIFSARWGIHLWMLEPLHRAKRRALCARKSPWKRVQPRPHTRSSRRSTVWNRKCRVRKFVFYRFQFRMLWFDFTVNHRKKIYWRIFQISFSAKSNVLGSTDLLGAYDLSSVYSRFCSTKKMREDLASFLPHIYGNFNFAQGQDTRYNFVFLEKKDLL